MNYLIRLSLILLLGSPSLLFADTLIFAVDIIRHGDRTPLISLPAVNYQWQNGLGQLTPEGMQQEYKMGMAFRKKYIEETHLLPEHYENGTMYVRSTDYNRTLMSAESLLMGLYPIKTGPNITDTTTPALPYAFQPIPIYTAPAKYDKVIFQHVSEHEHEKLMEDYVYSTKEWQKRDNELKDKYPLWSRLTGIPIHKLSEIGYIGDNLYIHKLHHAPMPKGMSAQDVDLIINSSHWAFMAQERPQEVAKAYHSKLMTKIAKFLEKGSQEKSKLKYVLLSAHDVTIAGALSYLGAPLETAPPYASNLNFCLYKNDSNEYTVKVTYNGKPVSIPACKGITCKLEAFTNLIESLNS